MCAPAAGNHVGRCLRQCANFCCAECAFLCGGQDQRGTPNPEAPAPERRRKPRPGMAPFTLLGGRELSSSKCFWSQAWKCLCCQSTKSRAPPAAGAWKCGKGFAFALGSTQNALGHNCEGKCNSQLMQIQRHLGKRLPARVVWRTIWVEAGIYIAFGREIYFPLFPLP